MIRPAFPEVIDNTLMNDYRACGRKAELAHIEHWKGKGESIHLHAGAAFARGLEVTRDTYYTALDAGTPVHPDAAIGAGLRALLVAYGDFVPMEGAAKTAERMAGALEFYFAEWPLVETPFAARQHAEPTRMPSGKRAIEFSFAEPLPVLHPVTNEPLVYAGRSDMICDYAQGVYIEDDKTASQLGDSWIRQWELRSQFTGYCWAARRAGIAVNGVLVRGVSILKTKYGAAEALTYRAPWEIERWLAQTIRDLERLKRDWASGQFDYNLGDACSSFGGCQFTNVCKTPLEDHGSWLPMYFERRRWDPLTRTETLLVSDEELEAIHEGAKT